MMNDTKPTLKVTVEDNRKSCPNLEDNWTPVESENVRCYVSDDVYDYTEEEYAQFLCDAWKHEVGTISNNHMDFEFVDDDLVSATNSFLTINNRTVRNECVTFTNLTGDTVDIHIEKMSGKGGITDDKLIAMRRKPPIPEPPILDPSAPDSSQSTNTDEQVFTLESNDNIYIYTSEPSTFSYYLNPSPILRKREYPSVSYDVILQTDENGECLFKPHWGYVYYVEYKNIVEKIGLGRLYDMRHYLKSAPPQQPQDDELDGMEISWSGYGESRVIEHYDGRVTLRLARNIGNSYSSYLGNYVEVTNDTYPFIGLNISPINQTSLFGISKEVPDGEKGVDITYCRFRRRVVNGNTITEVFLEDGNIYDEIPMIELRKNESVYLYTWKGQSDGEPYDEPILNFSITYPNIFDDFRDSILFFRDSILLKGGVEEPTETYIEIPFTDEEEYLLSFDVSITEPYFGIDSISEIILGNPTQNDYVSIRMDSSIGWIIYDIANESVIDLSVPLENANVLPPSNISIYKKDGEISIIFKGKNGEYECPLSSFEFDNTICFRTEYELKISNMKLLEYTIEQ